MGVLHNSSPTSLINLPLPSTLPVHARLLCCLSDFPSFLSVWGAYSTFATVQFPCLLILSDTAQLGSRCPTFREVTGRVCHKQEGCTNYIPVSPTQELVRSMLPSAYELGSSFDIPVASFPVFPWFPL